MTNAKRTACVLLKGHSKGRFESTATSKQLTTARSSVQVEAVKGKSQSPGKDRRWSYPRTYQGMACAAPGQHDLGGKKGKKPGRGRSQSGTGGGQRAGENRKRDLLDPNTETQIN